MVGADWNMNFISGQALSWTAGKLRNVRPQEFLGKCKQFLRNRGIGKRGAIVIKLCYIHIYIYIMYNMLVGIVRWERGMFHGLSDGDSTPWSMVAMENRPVDHVFFELSDRIC